MSASEATQNKTVGFIHELRDRRVWWRLLERLPAEVRPVVAESDPAGSALGLMSPPEIARQLETAGREALRENRAELIVASAYAATGAVQLVHDGYAARALLLDPDTQPLLADPEFQMPALKGETTELLRAMAPFQEQLRTHGTLPEEGIRIMVRNSLGRREELAEEDKQMLEELNVGQLQRSMPMDVSAVTSEAPPSAPDWLSSIAADPTAFTVYAGDMAGLGTQIRKVVALRAPEVEVIAAPTRTAFPWLEDPDTLASLVIDMLRRR